ncbi:hypothetical protein DPP11_01260 [Salmonella enterica subsp. enterica]|nr:hypothetical protein [Salmonella enterica subsp. enterica]
MAAFSYPAIITPQTLHTRTTTPDNNEPTATTKAPSRRAQTIIFIITHHRWRAMLSPPRLPALWGGSNAIA